ncbi:hypothetical protein BN59_03616 [Legionella massiliensis]|uniref:T6SS Phospholipase effector Tle1-like catalytic domain-containing protein n=1 Tax=Legionella massiliensis TaxID=1034943 RepID=A0A078L5S6_9GAMM|nr:DUF2235 domain-containing protein [Legionella massiliensis]CDZ79298.1 hypothetical protein BN59_03616 [Legionella massiliensis]CEE15036.1 hypothetical protein BN1094_03616 [Legionella massiliensis]
MKRIVICCDGTWNTPDALLNGLHAQTNVAKIAGVVEETSAGIKQMMFYEPGIGTQGNWLRRIRDGATGDGLTANMLSAYRYLIHNYEVDDELFFFGFSRGAFTVRRLAGMIRCCGILRLNAIDKVEQAFALYNSRSSDSHPRAIEATLFRRSYAIANLTPIKFIGVWDTVGALGNPLLFNKISMRKNTFHDYKLSGIVENAYHAVAIDEQRLYFQPALWEKTEKDSHQQMEQVWFAGVHCDVGGGYIPAGLSDIALAWMAEKAKHVGLGLAPLKIEPNFLQACQNSRTGLYRLISPYYRKIDSPNRLTCESLHESVMERFLLDKSYRPRNLLDYLRRKSIV